MGAAAEGALQAVFDLAPIIFMFFVPAITMGTFAEERRAGTIELLLTLPVRDNQVILSKVLAASSLIIVALGCTLFYVFTISILGVDLCLVVQEIADNIMVTHSRRNDQRGVTGVIGFVDVSPRLN